MNDCCNLPTYTFDFSSNPYNPTQVRLYGLAAVGQIGSHDQGAVFQDLRRTTSVTPNDADVALFNKRSKDPDMLKGISDKLRREFADNPHNPDFEAVLSTFEFPLPPIPVSLTYALSFDTQGLGAAVLMTSFSVSDNVLSPGIIFGYAYEGHCYDLPKPKVMLIPVLPQAIPDDDCCYSNKQDYKVWVVDKLDQCVEIEINQGFIEQIVLEANLPGKRSPSAYRAQQALAHRSGRLSD